MEKTEFLVNQELLKEVKLNPTKENKTNYFMGLYENYISLNMASLLNLLDECLFISLNSSDNVFTDMYFRLIPENNNLIKSLENLTKETISFDINSLVTKEMTDLYQYEISCKLNNYNIKTGFVHLKYFLESLNTRGLKDCYTLTIKENIIIEFNLEKIKERFQNHTRVLEK